MYQHCSRVYGTQWESQMGISNINATTTLQKPTGNFGASETKSLMCFEAQEHDYDQIEVPAWCLEYFPRITDPPMLICQASGDNFTSGSKQDRSTSQSVAESFLSSNAADTQFSEEEEEYSNFQPGNMSFYDHFPQEHDELLRSYTAATDKKPLEISFQRNQLGSCTKPEKQVPRHNGIAFVTSNNYASKRALTDKRRIRWTKDLHEPFMMIVDQLGGPEKAKPKAILDMMKSELLSISHVKSHLQKCRSTIRMHKPLHERSEERHKTDGVTELQVKILTQIEESRQLQLEIRKSISQQLEMQRSLQMLIEQQRKKLKVMLDIRQKERTKLKKILDTELEMTVPK